jgi:hypothetical protein
MNTENNRRKFFRIDDKVLLRFRKIDRDTIENLDVYQERFRESTILTAKFHQQQISMAPLLTKIRDQDTSIASYFSMLNDQVSLLATRLLTVSIFESDEPLQSVSISAKGMRFHSDEEYLVGDLLEMIYVLFPGGKYIPVLANVVAARRDDEIKKFAISVEYVCMHEDDEELVIRHNLYLQRAELQQKRLAG